MALAVIGAGALALAGCPEDNDKAVRDQMRLGTAQPGGKVATKQEDRAPSTPADYPGMKGASGAAAPAAPKGGRR
jgi:hypothetical protein